MKKTLLPIFLFVLYSCCGQTPVPNGGTIRHFEKFASHYTQARNVDVWLPDGYSPAKKYPVLYMNDGQMLFDSTHTWLHQEWQVDETMTMLIKTNRIRACIVVGIWNTGEYRNTDYIPLKPLAYLPSSFSEKFIREELQGETGSDDYLRFITRELKPFIDKNFSTYTNPENTFIAGSSKGGLISIYAICEYPGVFGAAACLSTDWIGSVVQEKGFIPRAIIQYLASRLPSPGTHKIYFDHGNLTRDSLYEPWQLQVDSLMRIKGYNSKHWLSRSFPGENHSENAWAKRLYIPLEFLLSKKD